MREAAIGSRSSAISRPTPGTCSSSCASESARSSAFETEHDWQLTQAHRFSGVIEWDPETEGALPLLIVDGRTFTWDQIGRMLMTFEGFTLNAIGEDTIKVGGGPLAVRLRR